MTQLSQESSDTQTIYSTRLENSMLCCVATPAGKRADANPAQGFGGGPLREVSAQGISGKLSEVSCFSSAEALIQTLPTTETWKDEAFLEVTTESH